ncbi:RcpC/CpaB family pilus assembly protein [Paludicola sp. MB14-C6]|uniref:Flp pilus assembly protein CpaB n=1 Tax=Paludihabitans sp. MB14-C6 TaxID=3070656 RepID=UPI0027DC97C4|nr:RcpC/CpaB family pilus assembly protein [Paludicola sp. MB14-C6]WMJ22700.1 RcpC/CpaB family pilus assembly protein [Paludicola sp. MB14-C6]
MIKLNLSQFFKKKLVLGLILVLVAVILLATILPLSLKSVQKSYPVVVVKSNIEKGQVITSDMIELSKTTDKNIAKNVAQNTNDVIKKYAAGDIVKNSYIYPNSVSKSALFQDTYNNLTNGYVALSVTFNSLSSSMSGKIQSNDIVTIFATQKSDNEKNKEEYATIPEQLRYVKVIAVTDNKSIDVKKKESSKTDNEETPSIPATATLLVTEQQASVLVALEKNGYLHFGLACRNNEERAATLLKEQQETNNAIAAKIQEGENNG